jgi:hypothetical protein
VELFALLVAVAKQIPAMLVLVELALVDVLVVVVKSFELLWQPEPLLDLLPLPLPLLAMPYPLPRLFFAKILAVVFVVVVFV